MAKGIEYLVGVRFQSSGNLFGAMKQLGLSFLAADEASKLLKNRFVDMTATGVAMFAALADGAQAYQNNLVKLENTMASTLTAHKQMASIYGGKVGSALGASTLAGVYSNMSQQLVGSKVAANPRLMKEAATTTTDLRFIFGAKGYDLQNSLFNAGVQYQRNIGNTNSATVGFGAQRIVSEIVDMMRSVPNRAAFTSGMIKLLGNPYTRYAGQPLSQLIPLAALLSRGGGAAMSAIPDFGSMLKGGLSKSKLPLLLGLMRASGLSVGVSHNTLAALSGSFLSLRGVHTLPGLILNHIFPYMNNVWEAKNHVSIGTPMSKLTSAQQASLRQFRALYIKRVAAQDPSLAAALSVFNNFTPEQRARMMTPTSQAWYTRHEKQQPVYWLKKIENHMEKLAEAISGSSPIVTALRGLSNAIGTITDFIGKHQSALKAAGGSFFGAAAGFSGAGIVALISRFVGAKGLFGKLGIVFRGLAFGVSTFLEAIAYFNVGYFVGTLLRGVPWIKKFGDYLGDIMIWMAKGSPTMKHFLNAIVDIVKTITFQGNKLPQAWAQYKKYAGGIVSDIKNFLGFGPAAMVGKYKNNSYMFTEHQVDPHTGKLTAYYQPLHGAEMHIHVHLPHGVGATSAKGVKDIAKAIADAVKGVPSAKGHGVISNNTLGAGR